MPKIEFGPSYIAFEDYVEVGVTHFVLHCLARPSDMVSQYETIAREIVPHFR